MNGYHVPIFIHYVRLVYAFFVSVATEKQKGNCPMKGLLKCKLNFYLQQTKMYFVKIKANERKIHLRTLTSFAIYEEGILKLSSNFNR